MKRSLSIWFVSMATLASLCGSAGAKESLSYFQGGFQAHSVSVNTERTLFGKTILDETNESDRTSGSVLAAGKINDRRLVGLELSMLRFENSIFFNTMAVYDLFLLRHNTFKPYIGGQVGLSSMTWKEDVDPQFKTDGESAFSLAIGARGGIMVRLSDRYLVDLGYQYTHVNLETEFESGNAKLILTAESFSGAHLNLICPF